MKMKKTIVTIIFVLSAFGSTYADDGDLPNGGRSCTNSGSCIVSNEQTTETRPIFSFIKSFFDLI